MAISPRLNNIELRFAGSVSRSMLKWGLFLIHPAIDPEANFGGFEALSCEAAFEVVSSGTTSMSTNIDEVLRFQLDLEFVCALADPKFLFSLASRDLFSDPAFINYLEHLLYFKRSEYVAFIR